VFGSDLKFIRQFRDRTSGMPFTTALLRNGDLLTSDRAPDPRYYFAITSPDTGWSFGEVPDALRDLGLLDIVRGIAYGGDSTFWAGPVANADQPYVVEQWSIAGHRLATYERRVSWYAVRPRRGARSASGEEENAPLRTPPSASARPMNVDQQGMVLVYVWVPNDLWRPLSRSEQETDAPRLFFNLHIEVIDPGSQRVLASETLNSAEVSAGRLPMHFFPGTRSGYRYSETAVGIPEVSIVEYDLARR
jgi:hypothetical protein